MMIRHLVLVTALGLCLLGTAAWSQQNWVYLDFDFDDDPWTIQTVIYDEGVTEAVVRAILEVGDAPPSGRRFNFQQGFGCCEVTDVVYLGASGLIDFYAYDGFFPPEPICMWAGWYPLPCPPPQYFFNCDFAPNLNLEPGERYYMGERLCEVDFGPWPCCPEATVNYWAQIGGEPAGSGTLWMLAGPSPSDPPTWGSIKSLYR